MLLMLVEKWNFSSSSQVVLEMFVMPEIHLIMKRTLKIGYSAQ
jgi:hypothetical protein